MKVIAAGGDKPRWRESGSLRLLENPISMWIQIEDGTRHGNLAVEIPAGWITDGASIPKAFRWFAGHPFDENLQLGFIWHDMFYATHYETRAFADALYKACLVYEGVGIFKRNAHYLALRGWGDSAWKDELINEIQASRSAITYSEIWRGK